MRKTADTTATDDSLKRSESVFSAACTRAVRRMRPRALGGKLGAALKRSPAGLLTRLAAVLLAAIGLAGALTGAPHRSDAAISRDVIKIGILNDQSGLYTDLAGQGSVEAARMAVEDFGGEVDGRPIEILSADHQNKPEIGASIVRDWIDVDGVDVVVDVPTSSVALAVQEVTRETDTAFLINGAASNALTNEACAPTSVHWTYTTDALASGTARSVVEEGGKSWFFVTADYAFGESLETAAAAVVQGNGGSVLGSARHELSAEDLTPQLMEATGSEAEVIAFANAGTDVQKTIRKAVELGIRRGPQRLVPLLMFITDVQALGPKLAQGLPLTTAFYWDRNDASRAFAERFANRRDGDRPTMVQAGVYSSVMHYLKALAAVGDDGGQAVVAQMKKMPVNDFFAENGEIRADGLMVHDMFRARVKTPEESTGPWDLYEIVERIPAGLAYPPLSESKCPLVDR